MSIVEIVKEFASWPKRCEIPEENVAYVVGIAGCTNSGKTTLSKTLSSALIKEGLRITVLSQDTFYHQKECVEQIASRMDPNIVFYNYDTIKSIDTCQFVSSLRKAIDENDFVIVEGNMILEIDSLRRLLNRTIFVTLNCELCKRRRELRKYDPPDLPGYIEEIVWPAYRRHLANAYDLARRSSAIVFVDGNSQNFSSEFEMERLFLGLSRNLALIQIDDLQLTLAVSFVSTTKDGAISIFLGTTRDSFGDKQVIRLEFEAYDEMVYKEFDRLCDEVRQAFPAVDKIAVIHKVGKALVGEASVIIATSAPHRRDAIGATERAIDYLKSKIPIWKKEIYSDGTSSWKENSECR